ncbi:hypothetical protein [Streptomyces xiamenensis]|uniref:hypothetical protein n=1 Tax=Streptomyces xiamenensis TaxID=408015 RepID=UPI0035E360A7
MSNEPKNTNGWCKEAAFVEITRYPLTAAAVRLVCGNCGCAHWAKAVDGPYQCAQDVPADQVADLIAREGYEVAGNWFDRATTGEWAHTARRAPVRRVPAPEPVSAWADVPQTRRGELLEHPQDGLLLLTTREGVRYELWHAPRYRCPYRAFRIQGENRPQIIASDYSQAVMDAVRDDSLKVAS